MAIANIVMLILFLAIMPEHFVVAAQTIQDALKALNKHKPPCEYSARWPNIEISRPSSTLGSIYLERRGCCEERYRGRELVSQGRRARRCKGAVQPWGDVREGLGGYEEAKSRR